MFCLINSNIIPNKVENYFEVQNHALWHIIKNGESYIGGTALPEDEPGKLKMQNDVKARSLLLMALPKDHLITFNKFKIAKTLFDAIELRFGGNDDIIDLTCTSFPDKCD